MSMSLTEAQTELEALLLNTTSTLTLDQFKSTFIDNLSALALVPRDASGGVGRIAFWPNELQSRFGQTNFASARTLADRRPADARCLPNVNAGSGLAQRHAPHPAALWHRAWEGGLRPHQTGPAQLWSLIIAETSLANFAFH